MQQGKFNQPKKGPTSRMQENVNVGLGEGGQGGGNIFCPEKVTLARDKNTRRLGKKEKGSTLLEIEQGGKKLERNFPRHT